jgi:hypothetical protein
MVENFGLGLKPCRSDQPQVRRDSEKEGVEGRTDGSVFFRQNIRV